MGRKSKEEIARIDRWKKLVKVKDLISEIFDQGEMFESTDVLLQLGFQVCTDCEEVGYGLGQCAVCSDYFCNECAPGHSSEETEL